MNAHILITDSETHEIVINNSFWALKFSDLKANNLNDIIEAQLNNSRKPYFAMIADFFSLRNNDLIFLYKRQVGFFGIYKIKGEPFFDNKKIMGIINESFPIRIELECVNYFEKPVPEELLFSTKEYEGKFWGWFYRKIQGGRGVNTINPEATESLIELLVKLNGNTIENPSTMKRYPNNIKKEIIIPLSRNNENRVFLEDVLRYYIVRNIGFKDFSTDLFGKSEDIEWFANNVPYHVSGKNIDILIYHKNMHYTGFPLRYQYTVVELKRDKAKIDSISQVINYSKWVSSRLANSEIETVQPILIAYDFDKTSILKSKMVEFNNRKIKLFRYSVNNNEINFEGVPID